MNRVRKGRRFENKVKQKLEQMGYSCYKPTWSKWHSKDVFGVFDLIAVGKKGYSLHGDVVFIQIKSNKKHVKEGMKKVEEWMHKHKANGICCSVCWDEDSKIVWLCLTHNAKIVLE